MGNDVDYVMSVRAVRNGGFIVDMGPTRFLAVPIGANPAPDQGMTASAWCKAVQTAGEWTNSRGEARGDILFVVHGYNMSEQEVMDRHRRIKAELAAFNFKGVIVSFDWPCDNSALAYLPDRHRAKETALQLVNDGIRQLSARQTPDCPINVHLLAHSTGAYVVREAFDDADDTELKQSSWLVSQILFAAGDVSAGSMSQGNPGADSVYNHCLRLTNYSNKNDVALDISNVKRLGIAPRVGRIGLPGDAPRQSVNVDCTEYYALLDSDASVQQADQPAGRPGTPSHSWYFGNAIFVRDVFDTVIGIENTQRSTRVVGTDGKLHLARGKS